MADQHLQESNLISLLREAADLLETVGTDDYVNPPTAEDMQRVAAEIREAGIARVAESRTDPYALDAINELIRRGSAIARERDRYRDALEIIVERTKAALDG